MKIGIVGIRSIGASLGWDLRELGYEVIGISSQVANCNIYLTEQYCDTSFQNDSRHFQQLHHPSRKIQTSVTAMGLIEVADGF